MIPAAKTPTIEMARILSGNTLGANANSAFPVDLRILDLSAM